MALRALLVYPEMPPTYWSMKYALPFIGRKAAFPPLGLLTVAAMLPKSWELRLVDLNVEPLTRSNLEAADLVMVSAMLVQRESFEQVIARCREAGKPVVAGGPYPTSCHASIQGVDHFVLGEAEASLPRFLKDFEQGKLRPCYGGDAHPGLQGTPLPRYDLVRPRHYAGAALQFSRGCPHHCEFCDIVELFGHEPRTKPPDRFLAELDLLYDQGWRGSLFIVDDNFIGHRPHVRELLARLVPWQKERGVPFRLYTEATLDLANDEPLMKEMVSAGFNMVFVGIETPDASTLASINKHQNARLDLLESVAAIQSQGLEVSAGFIVGFDSDGPDIFDRQKQFIEAAGIPVAMVGLLTALPGTQLHARLASEGRLLERPPDGDNTHGIQVNFQPRMPPGELLSGYANLLGAIYTPHRYFARCLELLRRTQDSRAHLRGIRAMEFRAFLWSLLRQTCSRYALSYWIYLLKGVSRRPRMIVELVTMAVKGHHFFTITQDLLTLEHLRSSFDTYRQHLDAFRGSAQEGPAGLLEPFRSCRQALLERARRQAGRTNTRIRARALALLKEFHRITDASRFQDPSSLR